MEISLHEEKDEESQNVYAIFVPIWAYVNVEAVVLGKWDMQ